MTAKANAQPILHFPAITPQNIPHQRPLGKRIVPIRINLRRRKFDVAQCGNGPRTWEKSGGRNWIRTSEGVSQQIYSLPPLATWVSYQPNRRAVKKADFSRFVKDGK